MQFVDIYIEFQVRNYFYSMINLPLVSKIYILLLLLVQYLKENVLHQHDKIQLPSNRQIYQSSKLRLAQCKRFTFWHLEKLQANVHSKLLIVRNSGIWATNSSTIWWRYLYLNFLTAGSSKSSISSIRPSLSSKIGRLGSASFYRIQKKVKLQDDLQLTVKNLLALQLGFVLEI